LRPVLSEIGASIPSRSLYLLDSSYDDPAAYRPWLEEARPRIARQLAALTGVTA
jgi:FMN reductase